MNKYTKKTYILIILCLLPIITHAELSPEFKMEQLIREAKISFNQKSYNKTLSIFKEIYALNSKIPPSARYMLAETYYKNKQFYNAKIEFENYVNQTGKKGRFFKKAMNRIAKINVMPWRDQYSAYNSNIHSEAEAAAWRGDFERLERLNKLNPKTLSNNKVISQLTKANDTKGLFFLLKKKIYLGNNQDAINKIKKIIAAGDFDTLHKINSLSPDIYDVQNSNNKLFGLPEIQNALLYEQGAKGYKFLTKAKNIGYVYDYAPVKNFLKSKIQKHDFSVLDEWVKNDSYSLRLDYVLHEILDVFRVPGLLYLLKNDVRLDPVKSRIATYLNGLLDSENYTQLKKIAKFDSGTINEIFRNKNFIERLIDKNTRMAVFILKKPCHIYPSSQRDLWASSSKNPTCQKLPEIARHAYEDAATSNNIPSIKEMMSSLEFFNIHWRLYYKGFSENYADISDDDEQKEMLSKNREFIRYAKKRGTCSAPSPFGFRRGSDIVYEANSVNLLSPQFISCMYDDSLLFAWPWIWLSGDEITYTPEEYLPFVKKHFNKKNNPLAIETVSGSHVYTEKENEFFENFFLWGKGIFGDISENKNISKIKPTIEFYCNQLPEQKKRSTIQKEAVSLGACQAVDFPLDVFKTYMAFCKPELEHAKCYNKPILSEVKKTEKRKILIEFGAK